MNFLLDFLNCILRWEYYFLIMGILSFLDIISDIQSAYQFFVFDEYIYFGFSLSSILISWSINYKET
jgi:hypothetical protein